MKKGPAYTFTNGPMFHMSESVTKHIMFRIIEEYQKLLGPGYVLDLEPIKEGGILFKSWPGKDPEDKSSYKSIRLCFPTDKWPWIEPETTLKSWENDNTVIYPCKSEYGTKQEWETFLKAFYGAPCWTLEELNALSSVFRHFGYFLARGRRGTSDVPKKFGKTTVSHGELGERK